MDHPAPPTFFLVCTAIALIFGAAAVAMTSLIIHAKLKKRSMNFPLAMLVQFLALMICLISAYLGVRSLIEKPAVQVEENSNSTGESPN